MRNAIFNQVNQVFLLDDFSLFSKFLILLWISSNFSMEDSMHFVETLRNACAIFSFCSTPKSSTEDLNVTYFIHLVLLSINLKRCSSNKTRWKSNTITYTYYVLFWSLKFMPFLHQSPHIPSYFLSLTVPMSLCIDMSYPNILYMSLRNPWNTQFPYFSILEHFANAK